MYIYTDVFTCRERQREKERKKERERERENVCVTSQQTPDHN